MRTESRRRHIRSVLCRHCWRTLRATRFGLISASKRRRIFARQARLAFEELGPTFMKLGQLISVRPDLFPIDLVFEMQELRDAATPIPFKVMKEVIENDLGRPLETLFSSFDEVPIGSASIAQVYRATLAHDYQPVVGDVLPTGAGLAVKVVRPGSEPTIRADIDAIAPTARFLSQIAGFRRANLSELLREFSESLTSECDMRIEGRVSDRFAFDFANDPLVLVPQVVWPLSSKNVLTMAHVPGWHLGQGAEAAAAGINTRALAAHGVEVFLRQVLVLGRFHADLHQSNLLLTPDGRICYLDFGIVGELSSTSREAILGMLAAMVYGDVEKLLDNASELGLEITPAQRAEVVPQVAELMRNTIARKPSDARGFGIGFLLIMNKQKVSVPRGFGLLVKALVVVEGCARMVDEDIDIVVASRGYVTELVLAKMLRPGQLYHRLPIAIEAAIAELAR